MKTENKHHSSIDFELVPVHESDIREVAELHHALFGRGEMHGDSLAKLGPDFLENLFYRPNLDNPHFFCDVARYQGKIAGFNVFSTDFKQVYRWTIRNHFFQLGWSVFRLVLKKPSVIKLLWSNIRYSVGENQSWLDTVQGWWQVSGVYTEYRDKSFKSRSGIHIAQEMFTRMEQVMREHDCYSWYGVTHPDNVAINRFLERHGAKLQGTAFSQGMNMNYFIKRMD